jgi:photosystem II stability/assembly factor-like uncharacterized protein
MGVLYRDEGKRARLWKLHAAGSRAFLYDVRIAVLFIVACSSPSPHKQLAQPGPQAPAAVMPVPDAAVAQPPGLRGDSCRTVPCAERLSCVPGLPGGYCASACDAACDGACIETRDGELCAKRCTTDRDCRTDEAYVCDPVWHACLVPNFASIVAKQCMTKSPPRDTAFGDSEQLTIADSVRSGAATVLAMRSGVAAVLTDDGTIVAKLDARLARDSKGSLYAATADGNLVTSTDRGATWSTPIAVRDPNDCGERACERPLIALGKDVVYALYAAGDYGMRVRVSRDSGKTFTTGAIALAGSYGNAATSSDGRLHVVAMLGSMLGAYGSAQQRIEYAVSRDAGATFSPPVTISARDEMLPFLASNPTVAVDDRRKWIYVAYARGGRDAAWDIVIAASKDSGATWKRTKLAGDGCAMHMVPNLAVDPATGTLHVAYYDSEGAVGRFVHASCGPGVTKCKVLGAINSRPFAALSLARQTSKWVGDYEALVVDDKRRLLHAVWAQTVDEGGSPVTRVFRASAKLKK